jgi:hypothetical protein
MMDGLDKVEKTLIVALVVSISAMLSLAGLSIYSYWYVGTHHDYGMKTVKTGDVTWVCLTDHGTTIGCDTVEEYQ